MVEDRISDAGGPRFESQTGRVTGKPTTSLWRDKHPAIKGLRPPEHQAGKFRQDQTTPPSQKRNHNNHNNHSCTDSLVVKDPISDAGGPRFESHAGRVTGKPTKKQQTNVDPLHVDA